MKSFTWTLGHTALASILSVLFAVASLPYGAVGYWLAALTVGCYVPVLIDRLNRRDTSLHRYTVSQITVVVLASLLITGILAAVFSNVIWPEMVFLRRLFFSVTIGWFIFLVSMCISFFILAISRLSLD
jgi:hypothetical protein